MTSRKKILILTPDSIEKAQKDLARLKNGYAYLVYECKNGGGITEIHLAGLRFDFLLTHGKETLDKVIEILDRSITYYQDLPEAEKQLDPPLRPTQPEPWIDQRFYKPPKMQTSYYQGDESLHPGLMMIFGASELDEEGPSPELTPNYVGKLKRKMIPQALELRDQLKREAAYMQLRFRERHFVFKLGETSLTIRHKRDLDHVILSINEAIERTKNTTLVERVFELFA
jgi:hypothetical protein